MKNYEKEFRKVKKFRFLPFLPLLTLWGFGYIEYGQGNKLLGATIIMIALIVYFYLSSKYKCPNCKYIMDPRTSSLNLNHCPKCGVKLQNPQFYDH